MVMAKQNLGYVFSDLQVDAVREKKIASRQFK
jgi:hypothetical protein